MIPPGIKGLIARDVFAKYVWVKNLKDKKSKTVLHGFIEILNMSKHKPNKLWGDQERKFYNNLMQKWLGDNDILIYSTDIEGKSVVAERFIRTLKGYSKSYIGYVNKFLADMRRTGTSPEGRLKVLTSGLPGDL